MLCFYFLWLGIILERERKSLRDRVVDYYKEIFGYGRIIDIWVYSNYYGMYKICLS